MALTMTNAGDGRVIRPCPAMLVLIQNAQAVAQMPIPIQDMDLRTLQSFTAETFQFGIALPTTLASGPVSVAVLIPDPAPSLTSNPAYALPLNSLDQNNVSVFDPSTGYNYVAGSGPSRGPAFEFTSARSFTSNPNDVIDGTYSIEGSYTGTGAYTTFWNGSLRTSTYSEPPVRSDMSIQNSDYSERWLRCAVSIANRRRGREFPALGHDHGASRRDGNIDPVRHTRSIYGLPGALGNSGYGSDLG